MFESYIMKRVLRIAIIVYLVFLVIFLCMLMIPPLFGYHVHSGIGDSMYPAIKNGSLVITAPAGAADIELGDIIAFKKDKSHIVLIHRVVNIGVWEDTLSFITKGDGNEGIDGSVGEEDIIGRYYISIPLLGHPVQFMRTLVGLAFMVIITALMIIILIRERRDNRSKTTNQ